MSGLTKLRQFKDDKSGRWASVVLASKEPCWISVARTGVIVKRSVLGLLGPKLYNESDVYKAAMTAKALAYLLPTRLLPGGFSNPVLSAFTNAAMHAVTAAEVCRVLNEAIAVAEHRSGKSISELIV